MAGLRKYAVRAPRHPLEQRSVWLLEPNEVVSTITRWTKHDPVTRLLQDPCRINEEPGRQIRAIGIEQADRIVACTQKAGRGANEALAEVSRRGLEQGDARQHGAEKTLRAGRGV